MMREEVISSGGTIDPAPAARYPTLSLSLSLCDFNFWFCVLNSMELNEIRVFFEI